MVNKRAKTIRDETRGDLVKSEIIATYDLEQVLSLLKKAAVERGASASYEFYHSCLDRLDELITERDSMVKKDQVVQILRTLSYFRPREYEIAENQRKSMGNFTRSEMQDDRISARHRKLIQKNADKSSTLPEHVFGFLSEHIKTGMFKDLFTNFDEEQ